MLLLLCNSHHLRDFGFGYFIGEYTADPLALGMYFEHYPGRPAAFHGEYRFQHLDHELHRRVVVVDENNAVQGRSLDLRCSLLDREATTIVGLIG